MANDWNKEKATRLGLNNEKNDEKIIEPVHQFGTGLLFLYCEKPTNKAMKYRHKMKLQEATKVKNQKRRVADCSERPNYTDEEVAKLLDYDYDFLLDMIYYKLEQMQNFFMSKHVHTGGAKQHAKQMGVAMRLINIAQGKNAFFDDDENAPYVNMKNYKRYEKRFYSCFSLRKEKAWHVLFMYLEHRMRNWWD